MLEHPYNPDLISNKKYKLTPQELSNMASKVTKTIVFLMEAKAITSLGKLVRLKTNNIRTQATILNIFPLTNTPQLISVKSKIFLKEAKMKMITYSVTHNTSDPNNQLTEGMLKPLVALDKENSSFHIPKEPYP